MDSGAGPVGLACIGENVGHRLESLLADFGCRVDDVVVVGALDGHHLHLDVVGRWCLGEGGGDVGVGRRVMVLAGLPSGQAISDVTATRGRPDVEESQ